jgi:hypothetical protein
MTRDQIDLQQSDKQGSLSRGDEALEAAHDGLMEAMDTVEVADGELVDGTGYDRVFRDGDCTKRCTFDLASDLSHR